MAYDTTKDRYSGGQAATSPARNAAVVTPSDTVDLPVYAKALYVGVSGNIAIIPAGDTTASGTAVTFTAVPIGWFPVQVRRVMSTNTTATTMVAVYD